MTLRPSATGIGYHFVSVFFQLSTNRPNKIIIILRNVDLCDFLYQTRVFVVVVAVVEQLKSEKICCCKQTLYYIERLKCSVLKAI